MSSDLWLSMGFQAAQMVATELIARGWMPDCVRALPLLLVSGVAVDGSILALLPLKILCSPSVRSKQTLSAMVEAAEPLGQVLAVLSALLHGVGLLIGHFHLLTNLDF